DIGDQTGGSAEVSGGQLRLASHGQVAGAGAGDDHQAAAGIGGSGGPGHEAGGRVDVRIGQGGEDRVDAGTVGSSEQHRSQILTPARMQPGVLGGDRAHL